MKGKPKQQRRLSKKTKFLGKLITTQMITTIRPKSIVLKTTDSTDVVIRMGTMYDTLVQEKSD